MASDTVNLTSTPTLLVRGHGHAGSERSVRVRAAGATDIVIGDAAAQEYTIASGESELLFKAAGRDVWAKSTGATTEVELEYD